MQGRATIVQSHAFIMDSYIPEFPCEYFLLSFWHITAMANAHVQQE